MSAFKVLSQNIWNEVAVVGRGIRSTQLWKEDKDFVRLAGHCREVSLLDPAKLYALYQIALNAAHVEGEVAELGVYKGGSARLLAEVYREAAPEKTVHLFDTFSGLPSHDASEDLHLEGDLGDTDLEKVKAYLAEFDNLEFHVGLFSETLPDVSDASFSLVHIDADLYSSIVECCEFLYPRLSPGGFMVFDDYGFVSCPGAKKAVDEFFADKPDSPVYLSTGQAMVVRGS